MLVPVAFFSCRTKYFDGLVCCTCCFPSAGDDPFFFFAVRSWAFRRELFIVGAFLGVPCTCGGSCFLLKKMCCVASVSVSTISVLPFTRVRLLLESVVSGVWTVYGVFEPQSQHAAPAFRQWSAQNLALMVQNKKSFERLEKGTGRFIPAVGLPKYRRREVGGGLEKFRVATIMT